jgi:hypothetical protein
MENQLDSIFFLAFYYVLEHSGICMVFGKAAMPILQNKLLLFIQLELDHEILDIKFTEIKRHANNTPDR